jgi:hypothetical protein
LISKWSREKADKATIEISAAAKMRVISAKNPTTVKSSSYLESQQPKISLGFCLADGVANRLKIRIVEE